jgi:glycosyltransferase involved in cell wall biosynthesis
MQANPDKVPYFSIVMPTYNRAQLLERPIQSVLDQSLQDWELIVIDDGSEDNTALIVNNFKDSRITYYYQENRGRSAARNAGIRHSKGKMLCFLDDDDWYDHFFLQEMQAFIEKKNGEEALFFCAQDQFNKEGIKVGTSGRWYKNDPVKFVLKSANNLQPLVIPRSILETNLFDERFELGEDFHLLLRLSLHHPAYYLGKRLVSYQIHPEGTMEKEFSDNLFSTLPHNRLDVMQDLLKNYQDELRTSGHHHFFLQKFNKIRYFYASAWLKQGKKKNAISVIGQLNFIDLMSFYYYLSIILRAKVLSFFRF